MLVMGGRFLPDSELIASPSFVLLYRVDAQRGLVRLVHLFYDGRDYARYV